MLSRRRGRHHAPARLSGRVPDAESSAAPVAADGQIRPDLLPGAAAEWRSDTALRMLVELGGALGHSPAEVRQGIAWNSPAVIWEDLLVEVCHLSRETP